MGWKYCHEDFQHEWKEKIAQPTYKDGVTYYPHPGRTRLGDHCTICGVAKSYDNAFDTCPEKDDMMSPHFVWPNWEPYNKE